MRYMNKQQGSAVLRILLVIIAVGFAFTGYSIYAGSQKAAQAEACQKWSALNRQPGESQEAGNATPPPFEFCKEEDAAEKEDAVI